jgi:hypothetical protein
MEVMSTVDMEYLIHTSKLDQGALAKLMIIGML